MALTHADYIKLGEDHPRCELVDGLIRLMAPAPYVTHQSVSGNIYEYIRRHLKGKKCKVFYAPIDVYLDKDNVLQPDIIVVCDNKKIKLRGCYGAPDIVVEILSKSTAKYDMTVKYNKYQEAGVKEYWVVGPSYGTVQLFTLVDGKYQGELYGEDDVIKSNVLPGLEIELLEIFPPDDYFDFEEDDD